MRKQMSATGSTSTAPPPTGFFCLLIFWQDMFSPMCLCLLPGGVVVQSCWLRGLPSPAFLSQGESFSEMSWTELCQVTLKAWNVIQQLSLNFDLWPFVPAKNVSSWSKPTYSVLPQTIVVQHSVHIDWCFALIILKWLQTVESKPTSLKSHLICGDS